MVGKSISSQNALTLYQHFNRALHFKQTRIEEWQLTVKMRKKPRTIWAMIVKAIAAIQEQDKDKDTVNDWLTSRQNQCGQQQHDCKLMKVADKRKPSEIA